VSARLAAIGHDVSAVTANPEIADAIDENGLVVNFDDEIRTVEFPAYEALDGSKNMVPFDLCVLAVPPNHAEEAIEDTLPFLTEDAPILCLPNGLIEERLEPMVGADRLVGGVVEFGARMLGPGRVMQTGPGGVTVGQLPAATGEEPLEATAELFGRIGPVHRAKNLRGARWSKLAINCAISSLGTIGGDRLGALMKYRFVRRLALETMTEVVDVANACGVDLEKVAGTLDLDWLALDDEERLKLGSPSLFAKHTLLLAVGTKYRKMRSSMLAAIERGRTPPVDFLNGEVVDRGEHLKLPTPINRALLETVHAIAEGKRSSSVETLRGVYEETRGTLRDLDMVG
jgi:2-dehydropantoate 2-reductase